jgi:PKD repeat protein
MRFSDNGADWTPWEAYTTSKPWSLPAGDGTKTVYYQIKDNAGLVSITYSDTIILDTISPTGSITINDGAAYTTTTSVTLTLSATDATSGIAEMRFSNDNTAYTEWQAYATSKSWNLEDGDGTKTVYVQFRDHAGLISIYSDAITLDTTPPTGSIKIAEDATYTNSSSIILTLSATDATSGVAQMRFTNDNVIWSDWEPYATSKSWTLLTGDGLKGVTVQYKDNAGLISSYSDLTILDTTKPTANAGIDQTVNEDALVTFDGSASTDENGIATYTWTFTDITPQTLTGKNPTYTFTTPATYTITLKVTDPAGNTATDTVIITVLDITKPTANAGQDQTVNVGTTVSFDAGASSDNLGVISYEWDFGDGTTGTGKTTTHTYASQGSYTVTLTVKDSAGNSAADTMTVTVLPGGAPPPPAEAFPMWIVGAAIATIAIAAAATLLWRRRK